jgi:hypothetical protein
MGMAMTSSLQPPPPPQLIAVGNYHFRPIANPKFQTLSPNAKIMPILSELAAHNQ